MPVIFNPDSFKNWNFPAQSAGNIRFPQGLCSAGVRFAVFPNYIQSVCQQQRTVNESINTILSVPSILHSKPQRDLSAKGENKRKSN